MRAIFIAVMLAYFVQGLYELLTPLYLTSLGISLIDVGFIFSIAALAMVLITVLFGAYTDIRGRKFVFASSFIVQAVSNTFFPVMRGLAQTTFVKILFDFGTSVRTALTSTIVYENSKEMYGKMTAWLAGALHLMMAAASFGAIAILLVLTYNGSYMLMGLLELIAFVAIVLVYKERRQVQRASKISLRETYSLHLTRNICVLMLAISTYSVGIFLSHGFTQPLYFQAKYSLSTGQIGVIIGLHRLSLAIPLFFTGTFIHKLEVKRTFVLSALVVSVFLWAMAFVNNVFVAVPVFMLHDAFGASIFVPAQDIIIQMNARDDKRGKDVNTIQLLLGVTAIFTPSLAGALVTINWDLIFIVGGALTMAASMILAIFYNKAEKPCAPISSRPKQV